MGGARRGRSRREGSEIGNATVPDRTARPVLNEWRLKTVSFRSTETSRETWMAGWPGTDDADMRGAWARRGSKGSPRGCLRRILVERRRRIRGEIRARESVHTAEGEGEE